MASVCFQETLRSCSLILISLVTLPISLLLVLISSIVSSLSPRSSPRSQVRNDPSFRERTVLVTGIGMAKGLTLARAFYQCGHRVIGADFETSRLRSSGRVSKACAKFHQLSISAGSQPYAEQLVRIIKEEDVDLWVSCSGVATALEDGQAQETIKRLTKCCCIQFNTTTTSLLHDKSTFLSYTKKLGLPVPLTYNVTSTKQAGQILAEVAPTAEHPAKTSAPKLILKPVAVDDVNRGNMTLLPLATAGDTETYLSQFPITVDNPWILQQYIPGGQEYCNHALVVAGRVKVFVACPSAELLMHYEALPASDPLSCAMLDFTSKFASRCNDTYGLFTGHLSFDFMVEDQWTSNGLEKKIYAIECNPRAHTAVVLFAQEGQEMLDMVQAYVSAIDVDAKGVDTGTIPDLPSTEVVTPPPRVSSRYWIGHDLISLALHPLLQLITLQITLGQFMSYIIDFGRHLFLWKEGTWTAWDPWPFVKLYHEYWPQAVFYALRDGRRWSRVNVSTTKMFTR